VGLTRGRAAAGACSEDAALVERWAETRAAAAWGRVCHAVAGELRGLLADWRLMLAQLEHQLLTGRLTLQARGLPRCSGLLKRDSSRTEAALASSLRVGLRQAT